ncbi:MAG: hypothetical protein EXQ52_02790 [Bryobacterales bacterium]|nr:hypothetical protein [Bryobacterales bacterium]
MYHSETAAQWFSHFFRECILQAREAADSHSQAEIAPFNNRSANAFWIGSAHDWDYLHGLDFSGGIAALTFRRGPIDLDEHGKIATVFKGV